MIVLTLNLKCGFWAVHFTVYHSMLSNARGCTALDLTPPIDHYWLSQKKDLKLSVLSSRQMFEHVLFVDMEKS